ncbi:unnamed protein product [Schistocephalus solidus]|uniref:C2H2-type domain-containing protein n=1 Tax=Schistocephalus solidus TaxID=70667 RepID=A0A183TPZ9_SCHSO|nr:unnamed protein product [Schistocephalus solidus]
MKTGATIYEANLSAAAKAKRVAPKSQAPRINTANAKGLPTCPRSQHTFHARIGLCQRWGLDTSLSSLRFTFTSHIGLVDHLRIHRTKTGELVSGAPTHSRDSCLLCSHSPRAFTHRMDLFGHMRIHDSGLHRNADNTDKPCTPSAPAILTATATPTTMNDIPPASTDFSCPQCARNFNSRIGLVGHLQIHRTEAGEPVPGAPTYSRRARLQCPHCFRIFTHCMGLLGQMRLHDNLR